MSNEKLEVPKAINEVRGRFQAGYSERGPRATSQTVVMPGSAEAVEAQQSPEEGDTVVVERDRLPINVNDLYDAQDAYAQQWGQDSLSFATKIFESMPNDEQLFCYRFARSSGARIEDIAIELTTAREIHKLSERAIGKLRYAVDDQSERLGELVTRHEALIGSLTRQLVEAKAGLDSSLNSVLQRVGEGLTLMDDKASTIEQELGDTLENMKSSLNPEAITNKAVEAQAESASKYFYKNISAELKLIAKREAKQAVSDQWIQKSWIINLTWLITCVVVGVTCALLAR